MIISILGLSGRDRDGNKSKVFYDCDKLGKRSGDYYNATHFLIENYNDKFYFLGTKEAISFQEKLLDFEGKKTEFIEIEHNSLDDIFENVFSLISSAKDNEAILLDITHGFRHQPISAIFSAVMHKFLNMSNLNIIFAKQGATIKEYEYIYLNNYVDMTQLALLLTGFIRTLNFVNSVEVENLNTLAFEKFSNALLSNDFKALISSYKNLSATINQAKRDEKFDHLKELFEKIEEILLVFKGFEEKELHQQYLVLAQLMFDKNYYLLSLTYLFESIRLYCSYSFYKKGLISRYAWRNFDTYKLNSGVINYISQQEYGENYNMTYYDRNFPQLYNTNSELFEKVAQEYRNLRKLRNSLTHINPQESQPNIKSDLRNLLKSVSKIVETDILKDINAQR